jgi:N-acetylmuramoyl-L-alanine amidase
LSIKAFEEAQTKNATFRNQWANYPSQISTMKRTAQVIGIATLLLAFAFIPSPKKIVVIDVGHGGNDSGAQVGSALEKEVVMSVARKIQELNTNSNIEIILSRDQDQFKSLSERTQFINSLNPDLVISLHAGISNNPQLSGADIFISNQNIKKNQSGALALNLLYSINSEKVEIKKADFYVLKNSLAPAALVELGFLSNDADRAYLTSDAGQKELAQSILNAIDTESKE